MKKLVVLFLLFATLIQAQVISDVINTTVANSATVTKVLVLGGSPITKNDSIALQALFTGEIDIDALIVTKGTMNGTTFVAIATPDTTVLTVDNAAAATTAALYSATSTGLNDLVGYDAVQIVFKAAGSGNDATDPNALKVKTFKYTSALK